MKVCFCEDVPGRISPVARLPLNRLNNDDGFRGFFSNGTRRCGRFGFFFANLPAVRRAAPSRIVVDANGVTYKTNANSRYAPLDLTFNAN